MKVKRFSLIFVGVLSLFLMFIFIVFSDIASQSALYGINLCLYTIIPSMLPIFVLNGILLSSGFAFKLSGIIGKPFSKLFGINKIGAYPFIVGLICGCPASLGAVSYLHENGIIDSEESSNLSFICSNISPSFLAATVAALISSYKLGIALYIIQVISNIIIGFFMCRPLRKLKHKQKEKQISFKGHFSFSSSLKNALYSIGLICGSVIFFSSLSGMIMSISSFPVTIKAILISFFEITSASNFISGYYDTRNAFLFLSAAVGWSGLSIYFQCSSVIKNNFPLKKYLTGKCISSFLCLSMAKILLNILTK